MGYACPVCEAPQVDGTHLADHLAFTALLGDDDHEAWLDEHAPGWAEEDDAGLADRVVEHATTVELPDDGTDGDPPRSPGVAEFGGSDHEPGVAFDDVESTGNAVDGVGRPGPDTTASLDDDARAALREAYEMTQERRERAESDRDDADDAAETE